MSVFCQARPAVTGPTATGGIVAAIACISLFALTLGMSYPLLALQLEARGISETIIGLNAAMTPLGLILIAFILPRLAGSVGAWQLVAGSIGATLLLLIALAVFDSLAIWFVLRLLLGVSIAAPYTVSETWINQLAPPGQRGRILGLYAMCLSLGFALGPLLLPLAGTEGWRPFVIAAGCAAIALIPVIRYRHQLPGFSDTRSVSVWRFISIAPALLIAVAVFGLFDAVTMTLLPVYGIGQGLTETEALYGLGFAITGCIVMPYPIGWLADRWSGHRMMIGCALVAILGCAIIPLAVGDYLYYWSVLFLWGGIAFSVYTLALTELGNRFSGSVLLAGNAAFGVMWGIGGIVGPPMGGSAMQWLGNHGLLAVIAASYSLLVVITVSRR